MIEKTIQNIPYKNIASPECVLRCVLRLIDWENDLEHSLQVYGFSPEWVLKCVLRLPDSENYFGHSLQENDFSPKGLFRWVFR